jgi:hypothetical protein
MLTGAHKTQRMVFVLTFFTAIPQRWRWIPQSHGKTNRWWNMSFICEFWEQGEVKTVDAKHIYQTSRKSLKKRCLPESWRQLFFGTRQMTISTLVEFMQQGTIVTSEMYCHSVQKTWNADTRCSAHPWQYAFAYSCSHKSTTGAIQLGVVWPPSLQP